MASLDPAALPLEELRRERAELQRIDDAVSYVRRVAQARIDLVRAEAIRRTSPTDAADPTGDHGTDRDVSGELRAVLATHLTGGAARPPRPVDGVDDHPLVDELEALSSEHGFSRIEELDTGDLEALAAALSGFEQRVSADRRARHARLDELSAELVRRYRDGGVSVDQLFSDPPTAGDAER